jgi:hypothetical protein
MGAGAADKLLPIAVCRDILQLCRPLVRDVDPGAVEPDADAVSVVTAGGAPKDAAVHSAPLDLAPSLPKAATGRVG